MIENISARFDEDAMDEDEYADLYPEDVADDDRPEWLDEPPMRFKETKRGVDKLGEREPHIETEDKPGGTIRMTVTAPNGKDYKVETRRSHKGAFELVLFDSAGREFVESFGAKDQLVELNAMAVLYATSIQVADELGQAFTDLLDSGDVQDTNEIG
jgi:hypothetical protein